MSQNQKDARKDWKKSLPFPAHWLGYIALKFVVLAIVVLVVLKIYGLL